MSEKEQWMEFLQKRLEQHMDERSVEFTECKIGELNEKFAEAMIETIADATIKSMLTGLKEIKDEN